MSSSFIIVAPSFDIVALPANNTNIRKILTNVGNFYSLVRSQLKHLATWLTKLLSITENFRKVFSSS